MKFKTGCVVVALLLFQSLAAGGTSDSQLFFGMIDKIKELPALDRTAIEKIVHVKFLKAANVNPYWIFFKAEPKNGLFSAVKISEPQDGATTRQISLILELRQPSKITLKDVEQRYGIGKISDIIPEVAPEGLVAYKYDYNGQAVIFEFTAKSNLLVSATIVKEKQVTGKRPINDVYVFHFVLDGLNFKTFNKVLDEGKIPTIKRMFVGNGAVFENAMSLFPTTSTNLYQSYTTGLFSGNSGIPHLARFDRNNFKVIDYLTTKGFPRLQGDLINLKALTNPEVVDLKAPTTIFELLNGYPTAAVYSPFNKGAARVYPKVPPILALWSVFAADDQTEIDLLALDRVMKLYRGDLGGIPRYSLNVLYSADFLGHKFGPDSDRITDILIRFDLFLKDFTLLLSKIGILDKTYIVVSADHGMHPSEKLFKLDERLAAEGIFIKPRSPRVKNFSIYAANRGVASTHIYARHNGGFKPVSDPAVLSKIPTVDGGEVNLVKLLLEMEEVDLIIVRGGERAAIIYDKAGRSAAVSCYTIQSEDYCSYRFKKTAGDPLGYSFDPELGKLLDGRPHLAREWLKLTADKRYPDAVVGFSQLFRDGRGGDVFVVINEKWGLRKAKNGNHGGAGEDDIHIPFLVAGPNVPRGTYGAMRVIDVYPLLLEWFGIEVPKGNYDGRDPFIETKADRPSEKLAAIEDAVLHGEERPVARDCGLLQLAKAELAERRLLVYKLGQYLNEIKSSKQKNDYVEITGRTKNWAEESNLRMEKVVKLLSK